MKLRLQDGKSEGKRKRKQFESLNLKAVILVSKAVEKRPVKVLCAGKECLESFTTLGLALLSPQAE